ncbi:15604_t:CDS:2, partial [Gigaspora rosea]
MSKRWKPSVTLIATGIIIPDLHFGPFLRSWWHVKMTQENKTKIEQYYPFRIGMKTQVILKNRPFIIRVVQGNKYNSLLPGFLYKSLLESNYEVENDPMTAISKLYKKIFQTETCFSGISIMGMNDNNILEELVSDLSFQPFTINLQKISIVIHSIERILVFQTVNKDRYSVCIYKENQISEEYCASDPNNVWEKIVILKKWKGITLFGLDNDS